MTNKMLHDLMEGYIDELPDCNENEAYLSSRDFAYFELTAFVNWLQKKGYKIESLRDRY